MHNTLVLQKNETVECRKQLEAHCLSVKTSPISLAEWAETEICYFQDGRHLKKYIIFATFPAPYVKDLSLRLIQLLAKEFF